VNCPWCSFSGPPRALHAHLAEAHPDGVRFEERMGRSFYALTCPVCGDGYEHQIKPRGRDPSFVAEYQDQIRLVAFDMLVNHLMAEHGEGVEGGEPEETVEEVDAPTGPAVGGGGSGVSPDTSGGPEWLVQARQQAAEGRRPAEGQKG
jgi:hypothetical protein